jgi:DDE superfamily endonuclease
VQVVIDTRGRVVTISGSVPGSMHELTLQVGSGMHEGLGGAAAMMDKGYVGVDEHYPGVLVVLPFEKPRGGELSENQKAHDPEVARCRIVVEHTMA